MLEIAIVGGGLCGLALANSLRAHGLACEVFEARPRLGGRIHSVAARNNGHALDLGAAWFWPRHQPRIVRLLGELGLASFPQHENGTMLALKDAESPPVRIELDDLHGGAYRIEGGTAALIHALAARLPAECLHPEHVLEHLEAASDHVVLRLRHGHEARELRARQVVLALPPRLVEERIGFTPLLNGQLRELLREQPTWMAGQAKAVAAYGRGDGMDAEGLDRAAFWRDEGQSGNAFARYPRAVLAEVHDACDALGSRAALSAFLALEAQARGAFRLGLPLLVGSQLAQLFGARAQEAEIHIQDWADEPWTCARLDLTPTVEHPAYAARALQAPTWGGRLHFGGSETAAQGGGYMEGALEAAGRLCREVLATRASGVGVA